MLAVAMVLPSGENTMLVMPPVCAGLSESPGITSTSSPVAASQMPSTNTPCSDGVLRAATIQSPSGEKTSARSFRKPGRRRNRLVEPASNTGLVASSRFQTISPSPERDSATMLLPSGERLMGDDASGKTCTLVQVAVSHTRTPSRLEVASLVALEDKTIELELAGSARRSVQSV